MFSLTLEFTAPSRSGIVSENIYLVSVVLFNVSAERAITLVRRAGRELLTHLGRGYD